MIPADWKCTRRVGFLFPHPCSRKSPEGCPDCRNGQVEDPYRQRGDRYLYNDYDDYGPDWTGSGGAVGALLNFTEADGENLMRDREGFEDDMSAS